LPAVPDYTESYPLKVPAHKAFYARLHRKELLDSAARGKERIEEMARQIAGNTYGRTKIRYTVQSGDVLGLIAERYHVRVQDLRAWNGINGNMIRIGQRLNIWVKPDHYGGYAEEPEISADKQSAYQNTTHNGSVYYVQPGDTLWKISLKYEGLSIEKLKELNNLKGNNIKVGQKLVIG